MGVIPSCDRTVGDGLSLLLDKLSKQFSKPASKVFSLSVDCRFGSFLRGTGRTDPECCIPSGLRRGDGFCCKDDTDAKQYGGQFGTVHPEIST